MKINGSSQIPRPEAGAARPSAARPTQPAGSSNVSISDLAGRLQSLEAGLADHGPVEARRVEEIKAAIREGQFRVNPEVVADRLIQSMRELLERPK
jgi:negative regulator of flagellin synthesis FlgM